MLSSTAPREQAGDDEASHGGEERREHRGGARGARGEREWVKVRRNQAADQAAGWVA